MPQEQAKRRVNDVAVVATQHLAVHYHGLWLSISSLVHVQLLERHYEAFFEVHEVKLELSLPLEHALLDALLVQREADSEQLRAVRVELDLLLLDLHVVLVHDVELHV